VIVWIYETGVRIQVVTSRIDTYLRKTWRARGLSEQSLPYVGLTMVVRLHQNYFAPVSYLYLALECRTIARSSDQADLVQKSKIENVTLTNNDD
jgi:hypothetical protein